MTLELNLSYVHSLSMGYGRYGSKLFEALTNIGVNVTDGLPNPEQPDGRISNVTCWVSVPVHAKGWWEGQRPIISSMWEATVLPESFRENLHNFEQVIVPSLHNVALFSEYHDNVAYVPLGIDPAEWFYVERTPPGRYFRFLIGGSGDRKGTDLAHAAFRKVFGEGMWTGKGPEPVLVMKNPRGEQFYGERVEMITGKVSQEEERRIYADAHCYLQPSRGEGFGLQPLQAIAQGLPTILTDAHGHQAFSHLGYGLSTKFSKASYFIYGDAHEWWEPNFDELCEYMRYVYDNYDAAAALAADNAKVVAEEFTWQRCAENFVAAVGPEHLREYRGNGSWFQPTSKRYWMRVVKPWAADIAGTRYQFLPGNDYYETADVKRVLFEAGGILDVACLDPSDGGLTPEQVVRIPEYTAAHGHCQLCGQRLQSTKTRADEIFAELEREAANR